MNCKPVIISIIVSLIVTFLLPICIATIAVTFFLASYFTMDETCKNAGFMTTYNKFMYGIPVANVTCEVSELFNATGFDATILKAIGGAILLSIIIFMIITTITYMSSYLCLVYHFSKASNQRTHSWFNCLKFGSYTIKSVWKENTSKSLLILIPNICTYILQIIYEDPLTYSAFFFTMVIFPTIIIACDSAINSCKLDKSKYVELHGTIQDGFVQMVDIPTRVSIV